MTGVYSATPGYPSTVEDLSGSFGDAADEGIQNDSDGNLWIAEDASGPFKGATKAKVPNSFLYRFVPKKPGDLKNGKLQVLQVKNDGGDPASGSASSISTRRATRTQAPRTLMPEGGLRSSS